MISVTGARKNYGDFVALDDVSLDVPAGTVTALVGPSGSYSSRSFPTSARLTRPSAVSTAGLARNGPPSSQDGSTCFRNCRARILGKALEHTCDLGVA